MPPSPGAPTSAVTAVTDACGSMDAALSSLGADRQALDRLLANHDSQLGPGSGDRIGLGLVPLEFDLDNAQSTVLTIPVIPQEGNSQGMGKA